MKTRFTKTRAVSGFSLLAIARCELEAAARLPGSALLLEHGEEPPRHRVARVPGVAADEDPRVERRRVLLEARSALGRSRVHDVDLGDAVLELW